MKKRIKDYRILDKIGQGGMGVVYQGVHTCIEQRVAIKLLSEKWAHDSRHLKRFLDEARALSRVQHPGLVQIFGYGRLRDGTVYIVMEYLPGDSLRERLQRYGDEGLRFDPTEALRITRQVAAALAVVHRHGIIHRDLKPENLKLVPDAEVAAGERVKLLDFGIAKFVNSADQPTVEGTVVGTPVYMAPEQCQGREVDGHADVYALGVILYEMLSGRPPFCGDRDAVMYSHITAEPRLLSEVVSGIAPEIELLVHGTLAKAPAMRPSMEQVVERIRAMEVERTVPALAVPPRQRARPAGQNSALSGGTHADMAAQAPNGMPGGVPSFIRRAGWGNAALAAAVGGGLVLLAVFWTRPRETSRPAVADLALHEDLAAPPADLAAPLVQGPQQAQEKQPTTHSSPLPVFRTRRDAPPAKPRVHTYHLETDPAPVGELQLEVSSGAAQVGPGGTVKCIEGQRLELNLTVSGYKTKTVAFTCGHRLGPGPIRITRGLEPPLD